MLLRAFCDRAARRGAHPLGRLRRAAHPGPARPALRRRRGDRRRARGARLPRGPAARGDRGADPRAGRRAARRSSCSRTSIGPTRRRSTCCACWRARSRRSPRSCSPAIATTSSTAPTRSRSSSGSWPRRARSRGSRSRRCRRRPSASSPSRTGSTPRTSTARRTATPSTSPRCSRRGRARSRTRCATRCSRGWRACPAPARSLLEAIAIATPQAEIWLLEALAPAELDHLEECLASGMVAAQPDGVAFRHELARLAVEEALPPHRRVALHRARDRGARGAAGPRARTRPASPITPTWRATGRPSCASRPRPPSARASLGAHREAAAQYARALRFADDLAPAEQAALLERRAYEGFLTGELDAAIAAQERALALRRALGDPLREGDCLRSLSRLYRFLGRTEEAAEVGHEAVGPPRGAAAPGRELALAYANLGHLYTTAEDAEQATAWNAKALRARRAARRPPGARLRAHQHRRRRGLHRRPAGAGPARAQPRARAARRAWRSRRAAPTSTSCGGRCAAGATTSSIATSTPASSTAPSAAWTCGGCSSRRAARAWSSTAGSGPRRPTPPPRVVRDRRTWPVPRLFALTVLALVRARRGRSRRLAAARRGARAGRADRRAAAPRAGRGGAGRGRVAGRARRGGRGGDRGRARARRAPAGAVGRRRPRLLAPAGRGRGSRSRTASRAPYAAELAGDGDRAAELWAGLGCPYEAALALAAAGDDDARAPRLRRAAAPRRQARGGDRRPAPARARRARAAARPARRRRGRTPPGSPRARSRSSSSSARGCATPTSRRGCSSPRRPSATTSRPSCASSACARAARRAPRPSGSASRAQDR